MTRRIVVGVDGSPAAAAALRWAARQAAMTGADVLEAVSAWEIPSYYALAGTVPPATDEANPQMLCARALRDAVSANLGDKPDVPVSELVLPGPAATALLRQAEGAELLVVGSRGLGGFTGVLLGSISRHVVEHAPCPVTVVRAEWADGRTG
ncbi:universal stress protein [Kitasatospora viridis]|uniref:Nucleotide-binding universal stress UspA family protein n=1 Tax=Kitasatospora viridis TaxID=281105 RepID=A0A561UPD0_9ACTN|nr:universal stress protein [Kitasatospora viridis]TWG01228.1 nucleotide-binding universal stress UspA family protein [Kitasatospora viridis]